MQLHDNLLDVSAIVSEPREGQQNPRAVSDKFTAARVEIASDRSKAWMDLVGFGEVAPQLAQLKPGQAFNAKVRLDSKKGNDNVWRVRLIAAFIQAVENLDAKDDQLAIETVEEGA